MLHLCEPVMFNSWSLLDKTVEAESNVFKDQVGGSFVIIDEWFLSLYLFNYTLVDAFQYYAQSPVSGERFNKVKIILNTLLYAIQLE